MKRLTAVIAALILALVLPCAALAFDVSGSFNTNSSTLSANGTINVGTQYSKGINGNHQVAMWVNATTESTNATIWCSPYGSSGFDEVKVSFADGTTAETTPTMNTAASAPVIVYWSGLACDYIIIDALADDETEAGAWKTMFYTYSAWGRANVR